MRDLQPFTWSILSCLVLSFSGTAIAQDAVDDVLRDRIDTLVTTPDLTIDGAPIAAVGLIDELYAERGYEPAWTDPALVQQLFDQVVSSAGHGLNPEDYHVQQIGSRLAPAPGFRAPAFSADTEILCTDALARLAVALHFGKLDPTSFDPEWNFTRPISHRNPVEAFNQILESKSVARALSEAGPQNPRYAWFRSALRKYRSIQARGGWPTVAPGPVLAVGDIGPRVGELRRRLRATDDLTGPDPDNPDDFDTGLEAGVRRFQSRHGLDTDGKVGKRTLEELNVPVEARINQLRASLERMRWVFRDHPDEYLIVDIAGYHAYLMRNGEEVWQTRVQVGSPFHATPVFKDTLRYLEFNPSWTIPPGILRNETLPAIRNDPNYLSHNNMVVITASGSIVDPNTVDWAATATGDFPFMIRQEPGDLNALGRIKFMFPNKYHVYLHDTPSKGLFSRSERAFSHGCIRTQNPFELAELLLADQGWDRARIDRVVASNENTRVELVNPITVMLLYWTAEADADGTVFFRKDVYNRDAPIIEGLDEPFRNDTPATALETVLGQ